MVQLQVASMNDIIFSAKFVTGLKSYINGPHYDSDKQG